MRAGNVSAQETARAWTQLRHQSHEPGRSVIRHGGIAPYRPAPHRRNCAKHDMEMLRNAGIQNINIDLIAGLAGANRDSWEDSLDWIERLRPPHVSVYIFEVDEDSRLGKEILLGGSRYGAMHLPSDDLTAEFYERAVERLRGLGLARYEISNFAQRGIRIPAQSEILAARAIHRIRTGCALVRWHAAMEQSRHAGRVFRLQPSRGRSEPSTISNSSEEHFFVGLRLTGGIEPTGRMATVRAANR